MEITKEWSEYNPEFVKENVLYDIDCGKTILGHTKYKKWDKKILENYFIQGSNAFVREYKVKRIKLSDNA